MGNFGETKLIKIIEELVLEKTGKKLLKDDSFFFNLDAVSTKMKEDQLKLVLNSDMFVSTTDAPSQMSYYQMGHKAVLMNVSDLVVKAVEPKGIIISLGLPGHLQLENFKDLICGIIDYCSKYNLDYIGGDLNQTKEIIINPTVFGFQKDPKIIYRYGMEVGDYLVSNGKFGLTGVGFDILLKKKGNLEKYPSYNRSIMSVLEPLELGIESYILAKDNLTTASIDSSDGLAKSLNDLMLSNPNLCFEINFNKELFDQEAENYSQEFDISLETLVFNGGEEFIHLFTINPNNLKTAQKAIQAQGGEIFKIGKVISGENIYILKDGKKIELKHYGFEHFSKNV